MCDEVTSPNVSVQVALNVLSQKVRLLFKWNIHTEMGTSNSNTVNSKFHLIRSYCKYLATILSFHV